MTIPADQLTLLQRIPHFDSTKRDELAAVFYLFKEDLDGTSFYRHNKTGYEYIDDGRRIPYFKSLESEMIVTTFRAKATSMVIQNYSHGLVSKKVFSIDLLYIVVKLT